MADPNGGAGYASSIQVFEKRLFAEPRWFAIVIAVTELALAIVALSTHAHRLIWLAAHLGIVVAATVSLSRQRAAIGDKSPYALTLLGTLAAGPIGSVLSALAVIAMARERHHPERLTAWYDRIALSGEIDPVTNLYNTVAMGRALQTTISMPPVFEQVMREGSLEDRQTALGLIARKFSPSYASALRLALISPEPVIRVQAAAVAVKVRGELKTMLAVALVSAQRRDLTPQQVVEYATTLDAIFTSGLIDDEDRDQASITLQTLLMKAASDVVPAQLSSHQPDAARQALLETQLLREGNFAAFRDVRGQSKLSPAPIASPEVNNHG